MAAARGSKAPTSTEDRPPKRLAYGVDKWDTQITNQLRELDQAHLTLLLTSAGARMLATPTMTIIEAISIELEDCCGG